ncbi:hypothetical protein NECHADRAFT_78056 [Paecilomyces variotii No. 5]|uniref:Siderophore iron transporter mirB n=1 Tax=Byssochlamys spectabilis (strain No. 5 / NBRC 109023) TaxID=1356009 RepID=V5G4X0_BYSSN|nr:hypothetical protein NECHADRAFT_78056 [Paecilomyces variotii No. 5]
MKAICQNTETYAAAQTLYWVGHLGLLYIIDVVVADMTTLKNRMIIFGINATPTIATVFAGSKIAQLYYDNLNFRWAFGSWAIILVGICIPILVIVVYHEKKAKKFGLYPEKPKDRTWWQACKHYMIDLATSAPHGWRSGYVIAMLVLGAVCLAGFVIWEKYFAPIQYLPWKFLKDRNIMAGCLVYGFMFTSIYCWDTYYSSYLQVVNNESITISGYVLNSFSLASSFLSPFVGLFIRWTGRYKWTAMAGLPFVVLGTALLVKFRTPDSGVGYLVMCQLFNGFGSGIFSMCMQIAVRVSVTHQEIAVVLAIWGLFGSIGAAIGETIAGALWTNELLKQLYNDLPEERKHLAATIYSSILKQKAYPMGSPIHEAIISAYANVMRKMVIARACFIPPLVLFLFMLRDINVKKLEKSRGTQSKSNVW